MFIHIVQSGDTLYGIAARYGVSPSRLATDNGISTGDHLVVGQALLVLIPSAVYTVQPGDTVESVAAANRISVNQLYINNPYLAEAEYLRAGETLVIAYAADKRRSVYINGYAYPYITQNILLRALPFLTYLTIFGYGITETGELIPVDDERLIETARRFDVAPVMLLSSVTESGGFSSSRASLLFNDLSVQNRVLDNIIEVMQEKGYVGLDIDFEYVDARDKDAFIAFVDNANTRLSPYGYFVNTDLAPKTSAEQVGLLYEAHDYGVLGSVSDTLLLMTYEWGYTYGPPLAVAPINKVRQVVSYAVSEIPPDKLYLGIPNYGYDWPLPYEKGVTKATSIGNEEAVRIAAENGAEIQFDSTAMSPYFVYTENNNGVEHIVWFEDVRSILAKFNLMDEFNLRGAGYWNIMRPFAGNFTLLGALYDIIKVL